MVHSTYAMTTNSASVYFQNLDPDAKARYSSKIAIIHGLDPLSTELGLGDPIDSAPPLDASDLVSYLMDYSILCKKKKNIFH